MALFYTDSSALVSSSATSRRAPRCAAISRRRPRLLRARGHRGPPAVRRPASDDRRLPLDSLLRRANELLEALGLIAVDRAVLIGAGAIAEPALRALDAIHVVAAVGIDSFDAFVTYDERQAAAARLAGLRTTAPGS